jgi:prophage regulatory protein
MVTRMHKLLRSTEARAALGVGETLFWEMIKDGRLTPPVNLTARARAWPECEIQKIIAARIAGKCDGEVRTLVAQLLAARKEAA